jgi:ABC-type nitrate/sulfonate/bicarbonate transport system substrate-binding protein
VVIGTGTATSVINMVATGVKAKIVSSHCAIEGNQGFVVRNGGPIAAPADLAGKKIGITTGWSGLPGFRSFLKEIGVTYESLQVVNGQPPDLVAAFGKGDIDGYAGWEPWISQMEKLGGTRYIMGNKRLYNGKDEPFNYMTLNSAIVVNEDYLAKNPNTVAAFIRGVKKGVDFINGNPDKAVDLLVEPIRVEKPDLSRMVKAVKYDLTIDQRWMQGAAEQADFLLELKRIPSKPELKDLVDLTILSKLYPEYAKWKA